MALSWGASLKNDTQVALSGKLFKENTIGGILDESLQRKAYLPV